MPTNAATQYGINDGLVEDMYDRFLDDRLSVPEAWWAIFDSRLAEAPPSPSRRLSESAIQAALHDLVAAFRSRGHLIADVDPLDGRQRSHPDLLLETYGLTTGDLDAVVDASAFGLRSGTLREVLSALRESYTRTIGAEYIHIADPEQREWLRQRLEAPRPGPTNDEQVRVHEKLNEAETFEAFLQTKWVGQTRFSLEGAESLVPLLDTILQRSAMAGLSEAAIGMAHRGRLNILTNIAGMSYARLFQEFAGAEGPGSGDVKYHLGSSGIYRSPRGDMPVTLAANPSHLEAVDGVLAGMVRAKQDRAADPDALDVLPILIHGDAAMAGQGVVVETLQMSQLAAYRTGGTIRININNQVGFTTGPELGRSSTYATDVAKTVEAPIFHVNGDDPEAVVHVAGLAFDYRMRFHRDVVIDLICYRRRGHNEADEPTTTHPRMYDVIEAKQSVRDLYQKALLDRGRITRQEVEASNARILGRLEDAFAQAKAAEEDATARSRVAPGDEQVGREPAPTGIPVSTIELIGEAASAIPAGFELHPKVRALLDKRREMSRSGSIDWAFAETLALGSLVAEGTRVRLVGQDARRGTFAQRHAVLHDRLTGAEWAPLSHLSTDQAEFNAYDSLLSEYAAMAFEYGYSAESQESLVIWEAQFGDFVNGAQIIVDEFVSSAAQKWGQQSGLVLLLPHGYEGQGPDHSSARLERFLQLCAEDNLTVAQPSTPASYFHLLRRHAHARPRRPLVVITPKSMLRLRAATSAVDDITSGRFEPVIDDGRGLDPSTVRRVVLVSGKFSHELRARLDRQPDAGIAIVRLEQLYPLPTDAIIRTLTSYPEAELVWAQEEPKNQGAWTFLLSELAPALPKPLRLVSRPSSAAPATGWSKRHVAEQKELIDRVLS